MKVIPILIICVFLLFQAQAVIEDDGIDSDISLRLTKQNFNDWYNQTMSGKQDFLFFIGQDQCEETKQLKSIWNSLGEQLEQNKSDIKLAHMASYFEHIQASRKLDFIASPTIYMVRNGSCYFYSWSLPVSQENLEWFIESTKSYYPSRKCPNGASNGFTTISIIYDIYIKLVHGYIFNEDTRYQLQLTAGALVFGLFYSLTYRKKGNNKNEKKQNK
ncbi:Thioredoxin-like fold [Pseudocohnilembus persalinus]|uniref:Thioredoxin-like fold n=1 Tax=Pseudocohnilembus persalinus TaxID=266149 RepID=A0A0V0QW10_PSEPJ|nr:Thioredoxin-like fold [Pseudocohnilembus persalinus]|eukprot:KRX06511.1 Thioredoxin-like fold [Pseudocohnilembus persalinus]